MNDITLQYPYFLLLFIVFIVSEIFFKPKNDMLILPHIHLYEKINYKRFSILYIIKWLIIVLLVISISSPVITDSFIPNNKKGHNIVLVVDSSASMEEIGYDKNNITKSKFDILKDILSDFIKKRVNDNIAIVVFGDFSFVLSPFTFDKNTLIKILSRLKIGIAGENTALYDGLIQAINLLKKENIKKKIIIFLTDGKKTAGNVTLEESIKLAQKYKTKIYTIGMGQVYAYNRGVLQYISNKTDGKFFFATNKDELENIYNTIDKLEKTEIKQKKYIKNRYLYQYFLSFAFLLLVIYLYMKNKRG